MSGWKILRSKIPFGGKKRYEPKRQYSRPSPFFLKNQPRFAGNPEEFCRRISFSDNRLWHILRGMSVMMVNKKILEKRKGEAYGGKGAAA